MRELPLVLLSFGLMALALYLGFTNGYWAFVVVSSIGLGFAIALTKDPW